MKERLAYASIGALLGIGVGALLWWLYGLGMHGAAFIPKLRANLPLTPWIATSAAVAAILGFVLKERVGTLLGHAIDGALNNPQDQDASLQRRR